MNDISLKATVLEHQFSVNGIEYQAGDKIIINGYRGNGKKVQMIGIITFTKCNGCEFIFNGNPYELNMRQFKQGNFSQVYTKNWRTSLVNVTIEDHYARS